MDVKTHNMKTYVDRHTSYQYYGVSSDGSGSSGYGSFAEGCGGRMPPTAPSSCSIPWAAGAGTGLPPASSSRTGSAVASARFVTDLDLTHCNRKGAISTKSANFRYRELNLFITMPRIPDANASHCLGYPNLYFEYY